MQLRVVASLAVAPLLLAFGCKPHSSPAQQAHAPTPVPSVPTPTATPIPWPLPAGVTEPVLVSRVQPIYPGTTRRHPWGVVLLDVVVTKEGVVADISVTKSAEASLDKAVIDAVRQWRYRPALKEGQPVAVHVPVSASFQLD